MSILDFHRQFAWLVVALNGVAGLWVLAAHWELRVRRSAMWPFVALAQTSIAIQVLIGVAAQQVADREATGLHMFYGFVAFATVGIIYSYRQQVEQHKYLLYGLGGLFLMGLALRSMTLI